MQILTYILPAHWACYLINGDASNLSDDEQAEVDVWFDNEQDGHLRFDVVSVDEDTYFSRYHDADNGRFILTEVAEYGVIVK